MTKMIGDVAAEGFIPMVKKIIHILIGWGKRLGFIKISSAEAKLAALRMQKCGKCEFAKESKLLLIINGDAQYEDQLKCTKCSCPCFEKAIVVDEKCPINKW